VPPLKTTMSSPTQHKTMQRATRQEHNEFKLRFFMNVSPEFNLSSIGLLRLS
jgi:hypothetical protein